VLQLVLAMKRLATILVLCAACAAALAQESRMIRPIERPPDPRQLVPKGAERSVTPRPVERADVEAAVRQLLQAWNERKLEVVLSDGFRDRQRLIDALQSRVPRDARLRLIALQSWQVVNHYRKNGIEYAQVSVTVRTQLEYNDPTAGFQRREGTNDFLVSLPERK
jgi:hypothetical protein